MYIMAMTYTRYIGETMVAAKCSHSRTGQAMVEYLVAFAVAVGLTFFASSFLQGIRGSAVTHHGAATSALAEPAAFTPIDGPGGAAGGEE
jgi:hypothetical protein